MSYSFISTKREIIQIDKLSFKYCQKHSDELLRIVNIIPFVHWEKDEMFSQEEDYYKNKWNYSYVIKNSNDIIIGILFAYFRIADSKHIFDSLYIHRLAILPEYQNIGIGTEALIYFIKKSFAEIPWLLNISVQTNDNFENQHVIKFYRDIGFKEMYSILYPNKTDILFLLERRFYKNPSTIQINGTILNLKHPRFNVTAEDNKEKNILPVIYFSTTNKKKREIVQFIFNNYNIDVHFTTPTIELTEPQIEKPEDERNLVSLPLKTISRFIDSVPYVIEDTMLFIEFFNRNGNIWELPGLDTKRWLRQLQLDGLLDIMGNTNKRKARFVSQTGAYIESEKYCYGRGEIWGTIASKKAEIFTPKYGTYPYFFHLIFIPDGAEKTLAEMDMHEYAQYDYMRKSIIQLINELSSISKFQREYTLFDFWREEGYL